MLPPSGMQTNIGSDSRNGYVGWYKGDSKTIDRAITAFTAIAWYNCGELLVLIFLVFKKYTGLYFWTLLITAISIIPYALGAWAKQVDLFGDNLYAPVAISTPAWIVMVTGQSLVLYSRLHLITQNLALRRFVLCLIIVDSILLCIPTAVLTFGAQSKTDPAWVRGYAIMEKIQITMFTTQECLISAIYLWQVRKILNVVFNGSTRQLMWEIVGVNVAIILMNVALLTVEYMNEYEVETTLKGMIYSIKLKLEFGVLSQLVRVVTNNTADPNQFGSFGRTAVDLGVEVSDESNQASNQGSIDGSNYSRPSILKCDLLPSFGSWSGVSGTGSGGTPSGPPSDLGSLNKNSLSDASTEDTLVASPPSARRPLPRFDSIANMYPGKIG